MIRYFIFGALLALVACGDSRGTMTAERRNTICTERGYHLPQIGVFVKMKLDDRRVQVVISSFIYTGFNDRRWWLVHDNNPAKFCGYLVSVRVNLHGIAHSGGNWSTAKPEVYPLISVRLFEITEPVA